MRKKKNGRVGKWHEVSDVHDGRIHFAKCSSAIFHAAEKPEKAKAPRIKDRCRRCK